MRRERTEEPNHRRVHRAIRSMITAAAVTTLVLLLFSPAQTAAQEDARGAQKKLPSAEKIVGDYLKAIGGKKRLAGVKDARYEWSLTLQSGASGHALLQTKTPAATRLDMTAGQTETTLVANARSAWTSVGGPLVHTFTGAEGSNARLQAALDANHLLDYQRLNIAARTLSLSGAGDEAAYVVEFSTREGGRLGYWFNARTKLPQKIVDEARGSITRLGDYRTENDLLEPHRVEIEESGSDKRMLILVGVRFNSGVADSVFDPTGPAAALDIAALLEQVRGNQAEVEKRRSDYSYTERLTERSVNKRGETEEETVSVYEVFPVAGYGVVRKLVSENGKPLSAERAGREAKHISEELAKAAHGERQGEEDITIHVADFLRACDFLFPRREKLGEREAIVMDFRPRAGFEPRTKGEAVVSRLVGAIWIDPTDQQVIRLDSRLAEGYSMAGGMTIKIRPGSSLVFEQTRMADGVWLPSYARANIAAKVFLFFGVDVNNTWEYSDYKRFTTSVDDARVAAPARSN